MHSSRAQLKKVPVRTRLKLLSAGLGAVLSAVARADGLLWCRPAGFHALLWRGIAVDSGASATVDLGTAAAIAVKRGNAEEEEKR